VTVAKGLKRLREVRFVFRISIDVSIVLRMFRAVKFVNVALLKEMGFNTVRLVSTTLSAKRFKANRFKDVKFVTVSSTTFNSVMSAKSASRLRVVRFVLRI
jgi:hypothetical protein